MKYLSVKQTAEKWGVSGALVRRYCKEARIPNAVLKENGWMIPANARKPTCESPPSVGKSELTPLAKKLMRQKKKKNYHGLYDYVQINLTYCSNRMASNRLTRQQVESIFRKGKVSNMFEPMKVSDMIEVMNHCVCVDYILDHLEDPLTPKYIKHIHYLLTYGTVDARQCRVDPGAYRTVHSLRKEPFITSASSISAALNALTVQYESSHQKDLHSVLNFHVRLERIFPFEDYNGRVGRLILFRECLRHGIMPFILDDKRRSRYLDGLRNWEEEPDTLTSVVQEVQEQFAHQISQHDLLEHGKTFLPAENQDSE